MDTRSSKSRSLTDIQTALPELRSFPLHLASERGLADNSLLDHRRDWEDMSTSSPSAALVLLTLLGETALTYRMIGPRKKAHASSADLQQAGV